MSDKPENMSNYIPDSIEKQNFEDDKLFEPSGTDSGFISSGNLIVSEEIIDEPEERSSDNNTGEDFHREEKQKMLVDSGVVCLSEDLSNLSLKNSNLNDLSSKSQRPVECDSKRVPVAKDIAADIPWKIYYQQDEDGDTHLHMAIVHGLLEAAFALIRIAPHPRLLDTPNDDALTPLHLAVALRHWRIVRWLVIAGARPGPRNLAGDSPLHLAARLGDVECCKAILYPVQSQERQQLQLNYPPQLCPTYDIEQWNYEGQTCVHVAAQHGHVEVLRHLVWYGANINAREGREGLTALHYAVEKNDEKLLNFLLNECEKIDLEMTTYGGNSALQLGYPIKENILEMLKRRGVASPYSSEDEYSSESDDEISYENLNMFVPNLVNASA